MATYYVAKTGNDANAGTSAAAPKLTIASALLATSADDIVEIIDEGTYTEYDLAITPNSITIQHTASELGRPIITGAGSQGRPFRVTGRGATYIGLEISDYTDWVFNKDANGYHIFYMSDCFVHDVPKLGSHHFDAPQATPATLSQSILFFEPEDSWAISVSQDIYGNGAMHISNCLITASNNDLDWSVLKDYTGNGTASFSTIITRTEDTRNSAAPVVQFGKVINCIVSSSSDYMSGIASDDSEGNTVATAYDPGSNITAYRTFADASSSAGTREYITTSDRIAFVNGDAVGNTSTIAGSYKLSDSTDSNIRQQGAAYDNIYVDLEGETRPFDGKYSMGCYQWSKIWTDPTDQPKYNFSGDFTSNTYTNLASNYEFRYVSNPGQAPFSLGTKGPSTLRGRTKAHKTTK